MYKLKSDFHVKTLCQFESSKKLDKKPYLPCHLGYKKL